MNILLVTMSMDIGGAETHILELAKALKKRENNVYVVSAGGKLVNELVDNDVEHIYAPLKDIRTAAMQYAQGNFDFEPIKIYSDDEIGDVANSLNYMASQLRDSNEYQQKFSIAV